MVLVQLKKTSFTTWVLYDFNLYFDMRYVDNILKEFLQQFLQVFKFKQSLTSCMLHA
jgi:hypothetical protein